MTDKELEMEMRQLRQNGHGWIDGKYHKGTKAQQKREEELSCIRMINSILAYSCKGYQNAELVMQYEETAYHNYLADYTKKLGRKRVVELIQGQIDDILTVKVDVGTDGEGVSYNSIVYKRD